MKTYRRIIVSMALSVFVVSCTHATRRHVSSLEQVEKNHIILVGKFSLVPKLGPNEQKLHFSQASDTNKIWFLTDTRLRYISLYDVTEDDYARCIRSKLDDSFYVSVPKESFYLISGYITMSTTYPATLNANMKIDIRPDDAAVYIGTIKFYRDEYFCIKKMEVLDELSSIREDFQKKFGSGIKIRRVVPVAVRVKEEEVGKENVIPEKEVKSDVKEKKDRGGAQKMF